MMRKIIAFLVAAAQIVAAHAQVPNLGALVPNNPVTTVYIDARNYGVVGGSTSDQSASVQAALNACPATGGTIQWPTGIILMQAISKPTNCLSQGQGGNGGTTFKLPNGANTYIIADAGYVTNSASSNLGGGYSNITFDGNSANQSGASACVIWRSRLGTIQNNTFQNCIGHALLITATSANGSTCVVSMPNNIVVRNNFANNSGAGVYGQDGTCNVLADQYILDNVFNTNGGATYWQADFERSPGVIFSRNKVFGVTDAASTTGNLRLLKAGGSTVEANNFDGGSDSVNAGTVKTVLISAAGFGTITITGNQFKNDATSLGVSTAATLLDIAQSVTRPIAVTGNDFLSTTIAVTSIAYSGAGAISAPLVARGNGFSALALAPFDPNIILDAASDENRIINGDFVIDQYQNGQSVTPAANSYPIDHWSWTQGATVKMSAQQSSTGAPTGVKFSEVLTTLVQTAPSAAQRWIFYQKIEGNLVADLAYGTASAKNTFLSFWAKSSLTGTFSYSLTNNALNRVYVGTYVIAAANTWQQFGFSIPGDTSGTWLTANNTIGLRVQFDLGAGSNFQTSTLSAWQAGNFSEATGAVQVVNNAAATLNLANVVLRQGSYAAPYQPRPYGTEFNLVQRYFRSSFPIGVTLGQNAGVTGAVCTKNPIALGDPSTMVSFNPAMMTTPTVTTYNPSASNANWRDVTAGADATVSVDPATAIGSTGVLIATSGTVTALGDVLCIHYGAQSEL